MSREENSGSKARPISQPGPSKTPHSMRITETPRTDNNGSSSTLDLTRSKKRDSKKPSYSYLNNPQTKFGSEVPHTLRSDENILNAPVPDTANRNASQVIIDAITLPYRVLKNVIGNHLPETLYLNGSRDKGTRDVGTDVQSRSLVLNGQTPAEKVKSSVTNLLNMSGTRTEPKKDSKFGPNEPVPKGRGKEGNDETSIISLTPLLYEMFFPRTPEQIMLDKSVHSTDSDVVGNDAPGKSKRVSIQIDDENPEIVYKSRERAGSVITTSSKCTDLFSAISQKVMSSVTCPNQSFDGNNNSKTRFPKQDNLKIIDSLRLVGLSRKDSDILPRVGSKILFESDKKNLRSHENPTTKKNIPTWDKHSMQTDNTPSTRGIISDLSLQDLYDKESAIEVETGSTLEEYEKSETSNDKISLDDISLSQKEPLSDLHDKQHLKEKNLPSRRGTPTSTRENKHGDATGQGRNSHSPNALQLRSLMSEHGLLAQECGLPENEIAAKESTPTVILFKENERQSPEEIRTEEDDKIEGRREKRISFDEHETIISLGCLLNQDKKGHLVEVLPSAEQLKIDGEHADTSDDEWVLQLRFSDSKSNLNTTSTPAPPLRTKPDRLDLNTCKTTEESPYKSDTLSSFPRYTSRSNWSRTPVKSVQNSMEEVPSVDSYDLDFDPPPRTRQSKPNPQPNSSKRGPVATPASEKENGGSIPVDSDDSVPILKYDATNHSSISSSMASLPTKFKSVRTSVPYRPKTMPENPHDASLPSLDPSSISRSIATTSLRSSSIPPSVQDTVSKDSIDALKQILALPFFNPAPIQSPRTSMDALVDPASGSIVRLHDSDTNSNSSTPRRPRSVSQELYLVDLPNTLSIKRKSTLVPRSASGTREDGGSTITDNSIDSNSLLPFPEYNRRATIKLFRLSMDEESSAVPIEEASTHELNSRLASFESGVLQSPTVNSESIEVTAADDSSDESSSNSLLPQSAALRSSSERVRGIIANDSIDEAGAMKNPSRIRFDESSTDFIWTPSPQEQSTPESTEPREETTPNDMRDASSGTWSMVKFLSSGLYKPEDIERVIAEARGRKASFKDVNASNEENLDLGTKSSGNIPKPREMLSIYSRGSDKSRGSDNSRGSGNSDASWGINFKEDSSEFPWQDADSLAKPLAAASVNPQTKSPLVDASKQDEDNAQEAASSDVSKAADDDNQTNPPADTTDNNKKDQNFPDASRQDEDNGQEAASSDVSKAADDENETNPPADTTDNNKRDQDEPGSNETGKKKSDSGDDNDNKQKTTNSNKEKEQSEDPATGNTMSQYLENILRYGRFFFMPTIDDVFMDTLHILRGDQGCELCPLRRSEDEEQARVVGKRDGGERGDDEVRGKRQSRQKEQENRREEDTQAESDDYVSADEGGAETNLHREEAESHLRLAKK